MKKFIFGLVALISLSLVSCGTPDYKAIAEKIEKDPTSLTQKDYSEMMDYVDDIYSDPEKLEKMNDLESLDDEPAFVFLFTLAAADYGDKDMDIPPLDKSNKAKYKKLKAKMDKYLENWKKEAWGEYEEYGE